MLKIFLTLFTLLSPLSYSYASEESRACIDADSKPIYRIRNKKPLSSAYVDTLSLYKQGDSIVVQKVIYTDYSKQSTCKVLGVINSDDFLKAVGKAEEVHKNSLNATEKVAIVSGAIIAIVTYRWISSQYAISAANSSSMYDGLATIVLEEFPIIKHGARLTASALAGLIGGSIVGLASYKPIDQFLNDDADAVDELRDEDEFYGNIPKIEEFLKTLYVKK